MATDTKKIIKEITDLKSAIEEAKADVASKRGERKSLLKQMSDRFGVSSVSAADKVVAELDEEIANLENTIAESFAELEETYEW